MKIKKILILFVILMNTCNSKDIDSKKVRSSNSINKKSFNYWVYIVYLDKNTKDFYSRTFNVKDQKNIPNYCLAIDKENREINVMDINGTSKNISFSEESEKVLVTSNNFYIYLLEINDHPKYIYINNKISNKDNQFMFDFQSGSYESFCYEDGKCSIDECIKLLKESIEYHNSKKDIYDEMQGAQ